MNEYNAYNLVMYQFVSAVCIVTLFIFQVFEVLALNYVG